MTRPQSGSARGALLPRSFRQAYPVATRAEGAYIWDSTGKQYLDFSGGAAVSFIGHGDPEVIKAMAAQAAALDFVHSSQFSHSTAEEFARELLDFAGPNFERGAVYLCSGGSEAVETAIKLARQYQVEIGHPGRFRVVSRKQSYHGATTGALALSGNPRRKKMYAPLLSPALSTSEANAPYCYRCTYRCDQCGMRYAQEVARALDANGPEVAAFIAEPVSGATLGAAVPTADYWPRVRQLCAERGVLLIADEVMTGFGRTGRNFGLDHWNTAADMIVAGKGIGSGYAPLAAVIVSRRIVEAIAGGSGSVVHGLTYNAQPVACAAGRAVLDRIRSAGLVERAAALEGKMGSSLQRLLGSPWVGDARGIGLLWGIELVSDRHTKAPFAPELGIATRLAAQCRERGIMVYPMQGCVDGVSGDHLLLAPPAIITDAQIDHAIAQIADALTILDKV